jgi:GR25 family glycosyltransferase involved in LPS biosynthesis
MPIRTYIRIVCYIFLLGLMFGLGYLVKYWSEDYYESMSILYRLLRPIRTHPLSCVRMPVYVINLQRVPQRWSFMQDQLCDNVISSQVDFIRVDASDAKTLVDKRESTACADIVYLNSVAIHIQHGYSRKCTPSELACTVSHLRAIRQGLLDDRQFCIIAEDDASFALVQHWYITLPEITDLIGSDQPSIVSLFHDHIYDGPDCIIRGIPTFGMVAYLVNRSAMTMIDKTCFVTDHIFIPLVQGIDRPVSDLMIYRLIPNSFMSKHIFVYPYNVNLVSTIHNDHTLDHLRYAQHAIKRLILYNIRKYDNTPSTGIE